MKGLDRLSYRHVGTGQRAAAGRRSRYFIRWFEAGRDRVLFYPTRDARDRARLEKERELNSWLRPPGVKTWHELVADYGAHLATRSPSHRHKVAAVLRRFWVLCRPARSDQITAAMCDVFCAARARGEPAQTLPKRHPQTRRPLRDAAGQVLTHDVLRIPAAATLRVEQQMLADFFAWASPHMPANPMARVARVRSPKRKRRPPRPHEWLRLLQAASADATAAEPQLDDAQAWYLLVLLAVVTGLRQQALLPLKIADVELAAQEGRPGLLRSFTGKTGKEDVHGLPPAVNDLLAERIAELPDGATHLFPWRRWQRKAWVRLTRAATLPVTFHSLRGAAGTQAALAKARQAGARHLAHSSVAVFGRHYSDDELLALEVGAQLELPPLPPLPARPARAARAHRPGRRPASSESAPPKRARPARGPRGASGPACRDPAAAAPRARA